jgi:hypothetical protein
MDTSAVPVQTTFKDRKTELIVFGIAQLLMAGFFLIMTFFMLIGLLVAPSLPASSGADLDTGMMVPAFLMYAGMTVWFVMMGVGSIKARRWARALTLIYSWNWMLTGLIATGYLLMMMHIMEQIMPEASSEAGVGLLVIKAFMFGIVIFFFVVSPGIFVLFYGGDNVKATCEHRDPKERWTDKCPLPVLALSLLALYGAVATLGMLFYGVVYPLFGVLLTGIPAAFMTLVISALLVWIAWGMYKLKIGAWWGQVALLVVGSLSAALTFWRVGIMPFYEAMNYSPEMLANMERFAMPMAPLYAITGVVLVLGMLGYLLWVRKFFVEHAEKMSAPGSGMAGAGPSSSPLN